MLLERAAALAGTKWKIISSKEVADCKKRSFKVAQVNQLQDLHSLIDGSSVVVDRTRSGTGKFTKARCWNKLHLSQAFLVVVCLVLLAHDPWLADLNQWQPK